MTTHTHINRYGRAYYIHRRGQEGNRKPLYIMSRQESGALREIPEGYEVRENVNGQVSIRQKRPAVLHPAEDHLIREAMKRHRANGYALQIDGPAATIYVSAMERKCFAALLDEEFAEGFESALAKTLPERFTPEMREIFRARRREENGRRPRYSPLLRFVLQDKRERRFRVDRVCFTGDSSWLRLETLSLPAAVMKYASRLGQDDFFELL